MDSNQFKIQFQEFKDPMFRLAESILHDSEAAMDAVQDLNLKLWEKRTQLSGIENFRAFVYKSMRNLCLDKLRTNKKYMDFPSDMASDETDPHAYTENRDMVLKVKFCIDRLPELQGTTIRMRDIDGLEIAEIAIVLSITENAVTANLSRARKKVREMILSTQEKRKG